MRANKLSHSTSFINLENAVEHIKQVELMLVKSQMQKQDYENEYNKIPESHRRSFQQRERKEFLKSQIDKLAQQINEGKLFIRRKKTERERGLM